MQALDQRIVRVSIEVNGRIKTYENVNITANGTKYANSLQNECTITLSNIDETTKNYILTETSPYNLNRTPKSVLVEAGRQSYGVSRIYRGNIVSSLVSQPPDLTIILKCLTGNFVKGNILARSYPGTAPLSTVAAGVAQDTQTQLDFQATDKNLSNYAFSGPALKQVAFLGFSGGVNVFIDDDKLTVKNAFVAINNTLKIVSADTGMVGVPEFTEQGVRVKFLIDNHTTLGGTLRIISRINPATNGDYVIYKLGFQIANRNTPFYYIAEAARHR